MDVLVAYVMFDPEADTNMSSNGNGYKEVEATSIPSSPYLNSRHGKKISNTWRTRLRIYLDSSATICLGGSKYQQNMELSERNLISSVKKKKKNVCTEWVGSL